MQFVKRALLPATVFITGGCVLVVEVVATRILAPYFGNTIFNVSSVISVVLGALSVGYYLGGKLADKRPSLKLFFSLVVASGLAVLLLQVLRNFILPHTGYRLPLTSGPLLMSMALFFVPSFILGMLSPFAIALQQRRAPKGQGVGTTTGEMFFFSTVGSIAGSLLAGFVLIPHLGITVIVLAVGVVLALLGLVPLAVMGMGQKMLTIVALLLALGMVLGAGRSGPGNIIYNHDGTYENVMVVNGAYNGRATRFLLLDGNYSAAEYPGSRDLVFDYTKYYAMYRPFAPDARRVLVMGGGAYSIPEAYVRDLPQAQVDVTEIEPTLPAVARKYFGLQDNPRLHLFTADARQQLHAQQGTYDIIFGDAYHSLYSIPAHLTTKEFFALARSKLSPGGVFIANVIGSLQPTNKSLALSEIKTMQQVFPQVYVVAVRSPSFMGTQNIIVVGVNSNRVLDPQAWAESTSEVLRTLPAHLVNMPAYSLDRYAVLTDDFAPVDNLITGNLPKR